MAKGKIRKSEPKEREAEIMKARKIGRNKESKIETTEDKCKSAIKEARTK